MKWGHLLFALFCSCSTYFSTVGGGIHLKVGISQFNKKKKKERINNNSSVVCRVHAQKSLGLKGGTWGSCEI